ncbi:aromatic amino acid aminotransferase, putative [Candida dubliniensis CD36]|uniref:Aromatic amino acid aminotransferase, putative n=1 Tax=Candida dubliniensis (strain CD36 / ATCC MYA-646 / CBS 7987 / NCPF 3949 / NRRL Y-17841) TaxID=573826 RepID=B9WGK8_CANDC|nr:aromatic amino acid aminotransferase, putative [Candida dubliniensis CD36]CAX42383.1 aromatic amino acid aminotransferase, putative [Candida dubliniensis CD36]
MSDPSHLISKRAAGRTSLHFTNAPSDKPPANFKPHAKPLALSYGMPNHGFFPIDSIDVNLVDFPFQKIPSASKPPSSLNGSENGHQTKTPPPNIHEQQSTVHISRHTTDPKLIDLARGLQYAAVEGHAPLLQFARDFIIRTHKPNYDDWNVFITSGASDGLNKAADAFLDDGDVILVEEFTFSPFLRFSDNTGAKAVPVKINFDNDSDGIDLDEFVDLLENWGKYYPNLPKPKALYTIATGQNPTGFTQSLEFRKKVYDLAVKHDFAIIEDDPYGYLTLPKYEKPNIAGGNINELKNDLTIDDYLKNHLTPSYLELDTTGRVFRVETFSKLFAPGLRLGFVVGHKKVIEAVKNYSDVVNRGASGLTQTIVNNVIQENFKGVDGWLEWILKMRSNYSYRKDLLLYSIFESQAYKKGYVDVIDPKAGMFVTFKVNLPKDVDVLQKMKLLLWKLISHGVLVVAGYNMTVDLEFSKDRSNFFRLCYALANNDEEILESGKRLTDAVYEFFTNGLEY